MYMKLNIKLVLLFVLFGVASFCFLIQSPNHPMLYRDVGTDSGVFQTVAMMMDHGFMPYKDSFDHKGPLIYLLDLLGRNINERWGVCFVEWCSLCYSLVVFYKISELATGKWSVRLLAIFVASLFLLFQFDFGNMTEEYAIPFIATSLYLFLEYQINGKRSWWRILIAGVCCASVVMLRPNMIATWIVYCGLIFITDVWRKKIADAVKSIFWFCIGAAIVATPILVWLWVNGALKDCWDVYIVFNMHYAGSLDHVMARRAWTLANFSTNPVILFVLCACVYFILEAKFKDNIFNTYFVYLVITLMMLSMSGRQYPHYAMVLVPAVIYPVTTAFDRLVSSNEGLDAITDFVDKHVKIVMSVLGVGFVCAAVAVSFVAGMLDKGRVKKETKEVCRLIVDNTSDYDKISVYGNFDTVYLFARRLHATRFSFQFPIIKISEKYKNEYWSDMKKELPKVVVVTQTKDGSHLDDDMKSFLNENGYRQISSNEILHKVYLR